MHLDGTLNREKGDHDSQCDQTIDVIRTIVSSWSGRRLSNDALICTQNIKGTLTPLYWCFQGSHEHEQLASALGADRPVHGMRSGHLVMRGTPECLTALAVCYAREMISMQPKGYFCIGGNCQGGNIAREVALILTASGREVRTLFLMEQDQFMPYQHPVHLIFGRDSDHNPYRSNDDAHTIFSRAYGEGYTISLIPGQHGEFFTKKNVSFLARSITERLDIADGRANEPLHKDSSK